MKRQNNLSSKLITLWKTIDGCVEQYISYTEIFLLSILSKAYYVIIYCDMSTPGQDREIFDGINATEFFSPSVNDNSVTAIFKIVWHSDGNELCNFYRRYYFIPIIKKNLSNAVLKHGVMGKSKNSGHKRSIMCRSMMRFLTKMLKCFVIQTNFHHWSFSFHKQKPTECWGWVNIIICDLIQLVHFTCEICQILYACAGCIYMLDKTWITGLTPHHQPL